MAHGFDITVAIKTIIRKALQINLSLVLYTDSKLLYNCLVKLGTMAKKRLIIDIICLREVYKQREVAKVK